MSNDQPQEARHQSGDPTLIAEFLLARIDEEEANAADCGCFEGGRVPEALVAHRDRECEAKRDILKLLPWLDNLSGGIVPALRHPPGQAVMRLMALPYSDHPDYRDEWRP